MSWLFTSGGQSIGASASASVIPMNSQDSLKKMLLTIHGDIPWLNYCVKFYILNMTLM